MENDVALHLSALRTIYLVMLHSPTAVTTRYIPFSVTSFFVVAADEGDFICEECHLYRLRHTGAQVADVKETVPHLVVALV